MNKSALSPVEKRVRGHLSNFFSDNPDPKFVVGVSGGPDSMALLNIFKRLDIETVVVHINYQKRGGESDKDQELVEQVAHQWGYNCHSIRLNPEEAANENFQHWARNERYRIFEEFLEEYKAFGIAVAHHRDDQIETILQKLFRGAGLESWSGMQVWEEPIFRPLLDITQEEITTYIEKKAIPYRTDKSNLESDFARNLLRNEWLNKLEEFFPGWEKNILRLQEQAHLFSEALDYVENKLTDDWDQIDLDAFQELNTGLQKALLLHVIKRKDPSVEISTQALGQIDKLSSLQTGKAIQLNDRYSLMLDREWLKIVYEPREPFKVINLEYEDLKETGFRFNGLAFTLKSFERPDYENALYLDIGKVEWPLSLRLWKAGDVFQPFGMVGHQKVSDHLTNRKVSASEKQRALVLESFEETICAVIFPPIEKMKPPGTISEFVSCSDDTSECLVIEWKE